MPIFVKLYGFCRFISLVCSFNSVFIAILSIKVLIKPRSFFYIQEVSFPKSVVELYFTVIIL